MRAGSKRSQTQKVINTYDDLRQEAMNEIAIDITRQTVAILLASMKINGDFTDDQLVKIYNNFVSLINTSEMMGTTLRSDEVSESVEKMLGIDLERINPKVGKVERIR